MIRQLHTPIPADLRCRLEAARLDLLALFRSLDQMDLSPAEIPQGLMHDLFELDADYAEALWALDQPPGRIDVRAMVRDTMTSLKQMHGISMRFRKNLAPRSHPTLENIERHIRFSLDPKEAYNMVPGRDPMAQ
jgi:hypothetical protein